MSGPGQLAFRGVSRAYADRDGEVVQALEDVDIEVSSGECGWAAVPSCPSATGCSRGDAWSTT